MCRHVVKGENPSWKVKVVTFVVSRKMRKISFSKQVGDSPSSHTDQVLHRVIDGS